MRRLLVAVLLATTCGAVWLAHLAHAATTGPWSAAAVATLESAQSGQLRLPRLVKKPTPNFPEQAVRAGVAQGIAYVQVVISVRGRTVNPVVLEAKPEGVGFEAAAIAAVGRYRYAPALQDGQPVAAYLIVPVVFQRARSGP
jgi:outer membrane biosynthesis protein TonB